MPTKTWTFLLADSLHTVTLKDDPFWGRRRVQIDDGPEQCLKLARKSDTWDTEYLLPLEKHQATIQIRRIGMSCRYDCIVDGISVETGQPPLAAPPFPGWGWIFIVLNAPLLIGGALGAATGIYGAVFCYGVARDDTQPTPIRALICTGATVLCWIIYLVLSTLFQSAIHRLRGH